MSEQQPTCWWVVVRHLNLGTRLGDHLSDPDTEDEHGHEGSDATGTSAEGLDEINPADDLLVLFLSDGKSGLAEKKLIRFVLRESATVDHQADKGSNANAPDDGYDMKSVHGVPQKKLMSWSEISPGSHVGVSPTVGGAGKQRIRPKVLCC